MSKGKYATRATLRREDEGVRSEIETYQNAVKRLTAERDQARAALAASRAAHKEEVRKVRAMLDEGLSPELLALRKELERQREIAAKASAEQRATSEKVEVLATFVTNVLHEVTGCTGLEAFEALAKVVLGLPPSGMMIVDQASGAHPSAREADSKRLATLQQVRGFRSPTNVIAHLDGLCKRAAAPRPNKRAGARKMDRWRDPE